MSVALHHPQTRKTAEYWEQHSSQSLMLRDNLKNTDNLKVRRRRTNIF